MILLGLLITVSAPYLSAALNPSNGRPVAPLDDAYITFQYARQIARGYPYQYNDGDPPTTGMTSPLFGFFLAGLYRLGFTAERLVAFAVGIGVVWLGLIVWLAYRLTFHMTSEQGASRVWPLLAAVLVSLSGPVQWGCFNGMETGLFTVLTLAALDAFIAKRTALCALWAGLAGLARPEGLVLTGLIWAALFIDGLVRSRAIQWRQQALLSIAVLFGLAPSLVNWALTGTTLATGLLAKSWCFNVPAYPNEIIRSILSSYRDIIMFFFLGWEPAAALSAPTAMLVFAMLGWSSLSLRRQWVIAALTSCWFLAGTLSVATLITATWHMGRYQVPFMPLVIVLAVCGLAFLQTQPRGWWRYVLASLAMLYLLISSACSIPHFVYAYRDAAQTMVQQHLTLANWMQENLPIHARVGITDAGLLRYVGGRPTYDMIGLTTTEAAIAWRHGGGSVFELMEISPSRPDYFITYPDVHFTPYLLATDLFARELFQINVPAASPLISPSPIQAVWKADWHLANSGKRFYQPDILSSTASLSLVDSIDIADLEDEAAHHVTWWQAARRPGFPSEVRQMSYRAVPERKVLDGGRLLTGGIAFDLSTEAGQPLWLVARLHAQQAGAVSVEVDEREVGQWAYPPVPGQWLETLFQVPAEAITGTRTRVTLHVDAHNPDFQHYAPYSIWALQGEPERVSTEIGHRIDDVRFAGDLCLLGFDLPDRAWHPGDILPITLYWQAAMAATRDAKVFVHLYDVGGTLGPQSDGWAFYGTRPPYTWLPGEIVADPHLIALPADLSTGTYSLEVGLYSPDGSGRLPVYRGNIHQDEERVLLAIIEVSDLLP
ncbi:MAG: hypothetical protein JW850_11165 [Thermoflexales bacterium]|nr:hypothetical protein [Thermoflexales bacterium]